MLKLSNQLEMSFSNYIELYDLLIDKDNFWRQLNDMIDFSFVYDYLKDKYSSTMGRNAEDIIRMFKFLLLKSYYKLSDRGLVERTKTDMLFKYFLGYNPEDIKLIDPSLLTVFRRERLNDKEENLMDKLIAKTVELAIQNGLIEVKNKIITDSTHTNAMYSHISPREELIRQAKNLRKSVYKVDESMHDKMPKKREASGILEDEIEYCEELLGLLKEDGRFEKIDNIKDLCNLKILDLSNNKITSMNGIESLHKLNELYLMNNQINKLCNLNDLLNLEYLILYKNKISDISKIPMKIKYIDLGEQEINLKYYKNDENKYSFISSNYQ